MADADDVTLIGWTRANPGRETDAAEVFRAALELCEAQKRAKNIDSYEYYSLIPQGGDLDGFLMLHGQREHLDKFLRSDEFRLVSMKAVFALEGFRVILGVRGATANQRIAQFVNALPKR